MVCEFKRLMLPADIRETEAGSYMIALYRPCEKILDASGNVMSEVKAVGYCLPTTKNLKYDLRGQWSRNAKYGLQFEVEGYEEVIWQSKEGITSYLSSGRIKGIGPKMAEQIFAAFGLKTLDVLDQEPERLLKVPGISQGRLKGIRDSYLENRAARDVVTFLAPYGITPGRALCLHREYGKQAVEIVKEHPYQLCETAGIGFALADRIAKSVGMSRLSPERVDAGILYTLALAETDGHLCMEKQGFLRECLKTLNTPQLTELMVAARADRMIQSGKLSIYRDSVYRMETAQAEENLAAAVCHQMKSQECHSYQTLDREILQEEEGLHVELAPEQKQAVRTALLERLCIITGGPGTGKTMIQRILLDIYRRNHPEDKICCCAPTGRAARHMEQSTGIPASTVHRALGLTVGGQEESEEPMVMKADLVLVDEVSMLDVFLAFKLFKTVKSGCHMVLVGDAEQLPSVGPGAVLSELIESRVIPVVKLDQIYRQDASGRIAANARLIRHGICQLEYGEDFQFFDSTDITESAEKLEELYLRETALFGVDHVALLTPYRQKTATGADLLNCRLQEAVNPAGPGKAEVTFGRRVFRQGDKVMQVKNHEDVNNGDMGYISSITREDGETQVCVDFGDGRFRKYRPCDLNMLRLGYASTIHKSQGAEYQSVIINLQCAHSIMLARPLVYTAVTRAKSRVILVGERRALYRAIRRTDTEKRQTYLAHRIRERRDLEHDNLRTV